jgi:hypothetical protein
VENELMVRQSLFPATFSEMMAQADVLVKSGLLPETIRSASAAVAIMMTGRELGLPPMLSFRAIAIIKGKPTLSAQLMGALIRREGHSYKIIESTNLRCVIEFRRKSGEMYSHVFDLEDAKRAGLTGDNWTKYPKAMLFSRCMSAGARAFMPDVIAGMYTTEELSGSVTVDEETGEIEPVTVETEPVKVVEQAPIAAPKGNGGDKIHWSQNAQTRKAFWAECGRRGLTNDQVHTVLGHDHLAQYTGTYAEALALIDAWINARTETAQVDALNVPQTTGIPF